jgi:hypothetical protein
LKIVQRWGRGIHMNRWRVGEDRGSKEMDGCPLTVGDIVVIANQTKMTFQFGGQECFPRCFGEVRVSSAQD